MEMGKELKEKIEQLFSEGRTGAEIVAELKLLDHPDANHVCQYVFNKQAQNKVRQNQRLKFIKYLTLSENGIYPALRACISGSLDVPENVMTIFERLEEKEIDFCLRTAYLKQTATREAITEIKGG